MTWRVLKLNGDTTRYGFARDLHESPERITLDLHCEDGEPVWFEHQITAEAYCRRLNEAARPVNDALLAALRNILACDTPLPTPLVARAAAAVQQAERELARSPA